MFTMYYADCRGQENNCLYPHKAEITDKPSLANAASHDYVCADYKGSYRSNTNFLRSDCLPVEFDNDHSDNPADWVLPEHLTAALPDVCIGIHYSRNHMKVKNGRIPRPKFHALISINPVQDEETYTQMKRKLATLFPLLDHNALDAARFFFGTEKPEVEFFPGAMTLDEYFAEEEFDAVIPEGSRNDTLFHFAVRTLIRYGDTKESAKRFLAEAARCSPPLEEDELRRIWRSAKRYYKKAAARPDYVKPEEYNGTAKTTWEPPIPLDFNMVEEFPIDALPKPIADYAKAVAENTQTPVDMAACASLSILAACVQGKFRVRGKPGWTEPLNVYVLSIASPSERKSAVLSAMLAPVNEYEAQYNRRIAPAVEASKAQKRVLERRQKAVEEQVAKGKMDAEELMRVSEEITSFQELIPLRLYVDDVTTEKLVSVMAQNNGRTAIISSEAGIFDTLAGIYSKNVNIDVMLKAYSGDVIRVDRIGRESESIMNPSLTVLLMAQPSVVSAVLSNTTFRGRGLTARFLYCMPKSTVGERCFEDTAFPAGAYENYARCIFGLLEDEYPSVPEEITLSHEAFLVLKAFADELEPKLTKDYAEIADWAGKLVGNTLRISGLLCRAGVYRGTDFLDKPEPLIVDKATMANAVRIGRYFLNHAQSAFSILPEDALVQKATKILKLIRENGLTTVDRRTVMRKCRSFKKAAEVQPVLEFLADYGYIAERPAAAFGNGRQKGTVYDINPLVFPN